MRGHAVGNLRREPPHLADGPRQARPSVPRFAQLRDFWTGQVDQAPLGLFRIVYGVLLVGWFMQLGPDLPAFFTDEGFLPRSSVSAYWPNRWSLLSLFGE